MHYANDDTNTDPNSTPLSIDGTSLAGSPVLPVSALAGIGIDPLRDALVAASARASGRPTSGNFRLAIDRNFIVQGAGRVTRRTVLHGAAAVGTALAAGGLRKAYADTTLRWLSTQSSPEQLAAYRYQIESFEAAHPGVTVKFERTSDEGYAAQLAAAFAGRRPPNLITHLPSFAVADYWNAGLLLPFDPVIEAVGADNFLDGANRVYLTEDNVHAAAGIGHTAANMLWLRTDLMEKAGIEEAPRTWDELRQACMKMQGRGVYGAPLPYARNSMTTLVIIGFIHQAGGRIFTPDLDVAIDSAEAEHALEFYRSMREFSP